MRQDSSGARKWDSKIVDLWDSGQDESSAREIGTQGNSGCRTVILGQGK
jgi:hypothetical protein